MRAVVFDFADSRGGQHVREFLGLPGIEHEPGWKGKLVADDLGGYKACFELGVAEVGCMAHARRKFHELWANQGSPIGEQALTFFIQLYEIEREGGEKRRQTGNDWCGTHLCPPLDHALIALDRPAVEAWRSPIKYYGSTMSSLPHVRAWRPDLEPCKLQVDPGSAMSQDYRLAVKRCVRARAPLRLGLAGGGTDVSPFCDLHGGFVLNAAIDKFAYAMIDPLENGRLELTATDQQQSLSCAAVDATGLDNGLPLHRGVYNRIVREFHGGVPLSIRLSTFSEAPAGSGLGTSSTLVVAMLKAFVEYLNLPLGEYEIARLAYDIERIDVGLAGGRQDQYSATFGGFNFMEFYADERVVVNPLRIKNWIITEFEASLLLYFTGVSRESASIISEQKRNLETKSATSIEASFALKREAVSMKESLLKGDFGSLAESMRAGWQWKKQLAHQVSNPLIDETYERACKAGALAGKVSGAGGGGFMFFLVDPPRRMEVMRALQQMGGLVSGCHFSKNGTEGWKL